MEANARQVDAPALTETRVLELWSKTYNTDGKPDWSHLFPYYHDEIVFQDSIQRIEGKEAFIGLCNRLTDRCRQLRMDIITIASTDREIIFDWTMTMMFKRFPSTPVYGCTKLTLHEDGRIIRQRDYYDLWAISSTGFPGFKKPYRRFMSRKFG